MQENYTTRLLRPQYYLTAHASKCSIRPASGKGHRTTPHFCCLHLCADGQAASSKTVEISVLCSRLILHALIYVAGKENNLVQVMALTWSVRLKPTIMLAICSCAWITISETYVPQIISSNCLTALAICKHSGFPCMLCKKVSIMCNKQLAQIYYYLQCHNGVTLHKFCHESGQCAGIKSISSPFSAILHSLEALHCSCTTISSC